MIEMEEWNIGMLKKYNLGLLLAVLIFSFFWFQYSLPTGRQASIHYSIITNVIYSKYNINALSKGC